MATKNCFVRSQRAKSSQFIRLMKFSQDITFTRTGRTAAAITLAAKC